MPSQVKWTQILIQCRDKVQKTTKPLLREMRKPQPDLGVGAGGDSIKKIDLAAEKAIMDTLEKYAPGFTLISEESGLIEHGYQPRQYSVPAHRMPGTTNLTRGMPFYATSIAVSSEPTLASVHTALVTDLFYVTTYTSQKGVGAFRDNKRISS